MTVSYTASYAAWPPGTDPDLLRRDVARAHEEFLSTGRPPRPVREVVRDSWKRSLSRGVDPEAAGPRSPGLGAAELRDYRRQHPMAAVLPVVRSLLVEPAQDSAQLVAVGDEHARLLWVEGTPGLAARAERIGFVEGAEWAEDAAGTNAPGTAVALGRPLQIYAGEHFIRPVHAWSCSAAPVRDPDTGAVIGVIDLTGGDHIAAPHALALVRATVAAAEAELRLLRLRGALPAAPARAVTAGALRLEVLARDRALLASPHGTVELSPRHSEIVFLLARHPRGLGADALAARLHEHEAARVTMRAEMSRLRRLLGPQVLGSRPYRLLLPATTDADEVRALLARGAHRRALARYPGPLLPGSDAPAIVDAREELHWALRRALRERGDAGLLLDWLDRPGNRDDVDLLQAALCALPPQSPRRAVLRAVLDRARR
ncbi:GAF domain-containing protein [Streptomyces sp. ME01-24h]|nr:GAF domain-containing protein [Streptomyces sp. ME19-03-3]MDX3353934.1 GAF domain-containing protein [Streptomyces sp. ME01-24h]